MKHTLLVLRTSLLCWWNRKAILWAFVLFAACELLLFPFALGARLLKQTDVQLGVLWSSLEFLVVLVCGQLHSSDEAAGGWDYYLASRSSVVAWVAGKIIFVFLLLSGLEVFVLLSWQVLYSPQEAPWGAVTIALLCFNLGSASLGTLVSALTQRAAARQVLQPILFFPLHAGILLAAVSATVMSTPTYTHLGFFSLQAWWFVLSAYAALLCCFALLVAPSLWRE